MAFAPVFLAWIEPLVEVLPLEPAPMLVFSEKLRGRSLESIPMSIVVSPTPSVRSREPQLSRVF